MPRRIEIKMVLIDEEKPEKNKEEIINVSLPPEEYNMGFDPLDFLNRFLILYQLLMCKGFTYGDSWKRRGELRGVIPNIDRKDDRFQIAIDNGDYRSKCDSAIDGAMYRIMYVLDFIKDHCPPAFQDWWESEVVGFISKTTKAIRFPSNSSTRPN